MSVGHCSGFDPEHWPIGCVFFGSFPNTQFQYRYRSYQIPSRLSSMHSHSNLHRSKKFSPFLLFA